MAVSSWRSVSSSLKCSSSRSWKNSSGREWSALVSERAGDLADQRHVLERGHAEQFLAAQDAGFGERWPSGVISTSPSLTLMKPSRRGGFDDGQQVVDFEGQIVGQVVNVVAAVAVDAAFRAGRRCRRDGRAASSDTWRAPRAAAAGAASGSGDGVGHQVGLREHAVNVIHGFEKARIVAVARPRHGRPGNRCGCGPDSCPAPRCGRPAVTASSMLCVTMKTARVGIFLPSHSSSSSARRFSAVSTSSAENGSSMKSTSGSTTSARANPTRCFMPPESSFGIGRFEAVQAHRVEDAQAALHALRLRRCRAP